MSDATRYTRFAPAAPGRKRPLGGPVRTDVPEDAGEAAPTAAAQTQPAGLAPRAAPVRAAAPAFLAVLFVLSILMPVVIRVGPAVLQPYRVILLALFVPLLFRFLSGKAGPFVAADWMLPAASVWASLSLLANHPAGAIAETIVVFWLEFLGAYLLGRVAIRDGADFRRLVRVIFFILLLIAPFAIVESITRRPLLLELVPNAISPVNAGIRMGLRRAQAVFQHPIIMGVFASAAVGLVWYVVAPRAGFVRRGLLVAVPMTVVFFSLSLGALVAAAVQAVFIGWEWIAKAARNRWTWFAVLAGAGYVILDLATIRSPFHALVHRVAFDFEASYTRIHIFNYGIDNVLANPLLGLGLNDWSRPSWLTASVDNFWLLLTMRHGVPFLVLFVGALGTLAWRIAKAPLPDPLDAACRAGWLTAFGGLAVAAGTVHYWQSIFAFFMLLAGAGAWMANGGGQAAPTTGPGPAAGPQTARQPPHAASSPGRSGPAAPRRIRSGRSGAFPASGGLPERRQPGRGRSGAAGED